jgi:hypothetical protein
MFDLVYTACARSLAVYSRRNMTLKPSSSLSTTYVSEVRFQPQSVCTTSALEIWVSRVDHCTEPNRFHF